MSGLSGRRPHGIRPWHVMVITAVAAAIFVLLRLAAFGGDISRFILAGSHFTDPAHVAGHIYVLPDSTGYDGQYYYRLALDPLTHTATAHGIRLASPPYDEQRILYPVLAWMASAGGRPTLLPWAMVVVNVVALAFVGLVAGTLAEQLGRRAVWGLALSLYPGFWVSLSRDLTEIVAGLGLLSALWLLRTRRWTAAAVAMTLASLTRETTILLAVATACTWIVRRPRPFRARAWLIPGVVFGTYQAWLTVRWRQAPALAGHTNLTVPFAGMARAVRHDLGAGDLRTVIEIALVVAFAVVAGRAIGRGSSALPHERVAWVCFAALAASAAPVVWAFDDNFLRGCLEMILSGFIIVLSDPNADANLLGVAEGATSLAVAAVHIRGI